MQLPLERGLGGFLQNDRRDFSIITDKLKSKKKSLIFSNQALFLLYLNHGIHLIFLKLGFLFSRKALRPSWASSVMYARRVASPAKTC